MKFLLDEGLPRSLSGHLISAGHESQHVGEHGLAGSTDEAVLEHARKNGQTVITLDADFHAILAINGLASPSVVRIRTDGLNSHELAELISQVLIHFEDELLNGSVVSIRSTTIVARKLPIRPVDGGAG